LKLAKTGPRRKSAAQDGSPISRFAVWWVLCLVVPAFAQGQDAAHSSLPDTPSPTTAVQQPQAIDHSLSFRQRVHVWKGSELNFETLIGPALTAAVNQARNQPPGFYQGAEGYADRYGSAFGRDVIARTIIFGFAAVDGEDPRYFRSQSRSVWGRTKHAVVSSFVSPTASGRQIPTFSHFAGAYGAAFIANAWYPDKQANTPDALRRGSLSLAAGVGLNLLREFVPRFNQKVPR
jgi:hypothetical protein